MGNYTIFLKFENPRRGRQARNFSENDPKILDLKSSSEQIIFRKLSLGGPVIFPHVALQFNHPFFKGKALGTRLTAVCTLFLLKLRWPKKKRIRAI